MAYAICLLGREPQTLIVATDASPEQVRQTSGNAGLSARRFRLAYVQFGSEIIEVATFRAGQDADVSENHQTDEGMLLRDNATARSKAGCTDGGISLSTRFTTTSRISIIDYAGGSRTRRRSVAPARRPRDPISRGPGAYAARGAVCRKAGISPGTRYRVADPRAGIAVGGRPRHACSRRC